MDILKLVVLSLIVESVVETLKMLWDGGRFNLDRVLSLVVGVLLTMYVGLDMVSLVGLAEPGVVGKVCTGILVSRGSNFMHDLLAAVEGVK